MKKQKESNVVSLVKKSAKENVDDSISNEARLMAFKYNITKIKVSKEVPHVLTVQYSGGNAKGTKEITFTGYEEMYDEDYFTIQALSNAVCEILNFPKEWLEEIDITGVTFNYDYDNDGALRGMVITMQKKIVALNCPLNINTPFIKFKEYVDDYSAFPPTESTWDMQTSTTVAHILTNTYKYMCGNTKTKQQNLFG